MWGCVCLTSPSRVFSILPFTTRANSGSSSTSRGAVMMGVLIVLEALMISLIRGTPKVICRPGVKEYPSWVGMEEAKER